MVLERIGGNKIIVKNRPSGVFMPHELYLMKEYPYESNDAAAVFRYNLTQQILRERQQIFQHNLQKGFSSKTYLCKDCLSEYLHRNIGKKTQKKDARRSHLTVQYIANALSLSLKRPEQHKIYIIERCPYYHFMIQDADGDTPKVSYPGRKLHSYDNEFDKRMLEGFTTDLPHIVSHFRHELDMCSRAVNLEQKENFPEKFKGELYSAFEKHGLNEQFKNRLNTLMAKPELTFY